MTKQANIAIIGASGYTGAELVRLLNTHPQVTIAALAAEKNAGKELKELYPQFLHLPLPTVQTTDSIDWSGIDLAFCCLPHGVTQPIVAAIPQHVKVVDLSADFRLTSLEAYQTWYGHAHAAAELQKEAVYGLVEINRERIKSARLIANPGCYPTSALLPLIPLLRDGVIETRGIVIDAKSGVTGAGRVAKEANLFCEVNDSIHAYGIANHRHAPEIEQELGLAANAELTVTFTPHLMPMNRGILSTMYVSLANGATAATLRSILTRQYETETFVHVLPEGQAPATRHVRGGNHCVIGVFDDRQPGRAILVSAIDNLVKGASGQAVQNMNLLLGFDEAAGIGGLAVFP